MIAISSVVSWLLMMKARSKVLNASMVRKMMAISSSGVTSGSVMRVNVYQRLARSMAAASYRCLRYGGQSGQAQQHHERATTSRCR